MRRALLGGLAATVLTAALLVATPAQAVDGCSWDDPPPVLTSAQPSTVAQWQDIVLTGTSPRGCGRVAVQRQIGTGPWTTIYGVQPVLPSSGNTFTIPIDLGIVGVQQLRVYYLDEGSVIFSNAKTVTVKAGPTPAPPVGSCGDDSPPPQFTSIPRTVTSGTTFTVRGNSPRECGAVTLVRFQNRQWVPVGVDTPGPRNIVGYRVTQTVPAGRTSWRVTYALRYVEEGYAVYSTSFTVTATR